MLLSFVLENPIPFTASYDSKLKQTWSPFVWSRFLNYFLFCFLFCKRLRLTCNRIFEFAYGCKFLKVLCAEKVQKEPNIAPDTNLMQTRCLFVFSWLFFFQLFARFIFRWPYFALNLAMVTSQCERRLNNEKLNHATPASKCVQLL